ncbi:MULTISPECIES: PLD nuclease N-terminal domain-containing protein [unclassified Kribbella]|uniref:PLD nuclease N-terminal domain-containing protein n=1 Tax=unclassified Kribbella TaxID=2644121 RepID=UPI00301911CE
MVRFLPFLISLALSVYALFSCIQTPDEDVPHLPKLVWIVLIVFVPFVGPIVWLLMLRMQLGRRDREVRPPKPGTRPVAPDDDPDFLKSLDRYRDPRTTVKPPEDQTPPPPEPEAAAEPDEPDRKPKPKAEDETPSESDDGKA